MNTACFPVSVLFPSRRTCPKSGGSFEVLKTLCVQLFSAGDPGDALLIYRAKESSFDAACYIDIELTCGAGVERTRSFLENSQDPDAGHLLKRLEAGLSIDDFTPEGHLEFYRRYYRLPSPAWPLPAEVYAVQIARWPAQGKHILAHYDPETIIVYQAFRRAIAAYAIAHQKFGGEFSYSRMSWIKPNFLWMMYRSGWGTKEGQEMTLGLRLRRTFFDSFLAGAVASSFGQSGYPSLEAWQAALKTSEVRLQWDPDHDPAGNAVTRRALQLGLRGQMLADFGQRELLEVIDMTEFVAEQRNALQRTGPANLNLPIERVYVPGDPATALHIGLD